VALALLGFVEGPIDLVVSGINPHGNMGHDVTYSGTVTAAMEAVIAGVPGIAFSLAGNETQRQVHYETAAIAARNVVSTVVEQGLTPGTLLNVNVPNLPADEVAGIQVTRLGLRVYHAVLDRRQDPRGRAYYWIGGTAPSGVPDEGTDIVAVAEGHISVTPLTLDLTDYRRAQELSLWPWRKEESISPNGQP
jgi:5'-nucleotidase